MTNDALKMPDEIYLLHNEGDMGEHLWCENIPNDEMEFTKYIRADLAAQGYIGVPKWLNEVKPLIDAMAGHKLSDEMDVHEYEILDGVFEHEYDVMVKHARKLQALIKQRKE